jgi:xanthine/uracil/vitamin C permease (AzgA family)
VAEEKEADIVTMFQPKEIEDARFSAEIRAGITTFTTMAYVIAVNVQLHSCRTGVVRFS